MTRRFPTAAAIERINTFFELPATGQEQIWETELSDEYRVQEFINAYRENKWTDDERFALMAIIISSYDFVLMCLGHDPALWSQISELLFQDAEFYKAILEDWARWGWEDDEDGLLFEITPYIREVILMSKK